MHMVMYERKFGETIEMIYDGCSGIRLGTVNQRQAATSRLNDFQKRLSALTLPRKQIFGKFCNRCQGEGDDDGSVAENC